MRTLAIDTASDACSVALFDGGDVLAADRIVLGRGHAERLVPMICALPDKGRAHRILVSLGPGSFTGVRIGISAARALGLAWKAEVLGYPTLHLIAAMAQSRCGDGVTVCTNAGHGEWFVQNFAVDGTPEDGPLSLPPTDAAAAARHRIVAGSRARECAATGASDSVALDLLPDAREAMLLPAASLRADLAPIYGRGPDARLPR